MRKSSIAIVILAVMSALFFATGASAQATAPSAAAGQPPGKVKVVFHYGYPVPLKNCLEQTGILIDGVPVHQIFQCHVWQTEVTPGVHVFSDDSHKDKGLTETLVAGQTYFYALKFHKGGFVPKCDNFYNKVSAMSPKEVSKAAALLGKPGMDETAVTPAAAPEVAKNTNVKLSIMSTPEAADIEVDGNFMGNTPSAIELAPGEHTIVVSKNHYKQWQRKIKLAAGDIKLNAELEADAPKQ